MLMLMLREDAGAEADAHVDADAGADTNLDSISLSKLCNNTLSCHRVLVVAVMDLVRIFFSSARIQTCRGSGRRSLPARSHCN